MDWGGSDHQGSQNGTLKQLLCFSLWVGNKQTFCKDKTGLSLH